jgi:hypothetical protein
MREHIRLVFEGESPCDKCSLAKECQTYEWACRAFSSYVLRGTFHAHTARIPTRELFNKIFKEDDKALRNYLASMRLKEEMRKK